MTDSNMIRQKVQQARELVKKGQYVQAKALLKGIDHPKVKALVSQLEAHIAAEPTSTGRTFPLLPLLGLAGVVLILLIGGGLLLSQRARPTSETILPTATEALMQEACTDTTVTAWWQIQIQPDRELNTFSVDANAAWSTMPGDWLTNQIDKLKATHAATFLDVPACASPELRTALDSVLATMDTMLTVLEQWNQGDLDGLQITNQFYAANEAFNKAQKDVRAKLP